MEAIPAASEWNHVGSNGDSDCVATAAGGSSGSPSRFLELDGVVKCQYPRSDITVSIRKAYIGGDHRKYPGSLIEEIRRRSIEEGRKETSLEMDDDSGRHSDGQSTGCGEDGEELTSYDVETDGFGESSLMIADESRSIGFDSVCGRV